MKTQKTTPTALEDIKVSLKLKLAAIWTALMFLYIYVDYFHLYMPGIVDDILNNRVYTFDITQGFLSFAMASMSIPPLMIFFSVALPAKINRLVNIIVALVFIPYTLFNLAGEAWPHMVFAALTEVAFLCLVIGYAWKWPRVET